jgi:hypothetical protein
MLSISAGIDQLSLLQNHLLLTDAALELPDLSKLSLSVYDTDGFANGDWTRDQCYDFENYLCRKKLTKNNIFKIPNCCKFLKNIDHNIGFHEKRRLDSPQICKNS